MWQANDRLRCNEMKKAVTEKREERLCRNDVVERKQGERKVCERLPTRLFCNLDPPSAQEQERAFVGACLCVAGIQLFLKASSCCLSQVTVSSSGSDDCSRLTLPNIIDSFSCFSVIGR